MQETLDSKEEKSMFFMREQKRKIFSENTNEIKQQVSLFAKKCLD